MKKLIILFTVIFVTGALYAQRDSAFSVVLREQDIAKKQQLYEEYIKSTANDTTTEVKKNRERLPSIMLSAYKEADSIKQFAALASQMPPAQIAFSYLDYAQKLIKRKAHLDYAKNFASLALEGANNGTQWKDVIKDGKIQVKDSVTLERLKFSYARYPDTYAQACYLTGDYKDGYPSAKLAAIEIANSQDWGYNEHYALLVAKVLPAAEAKTELERLFNTGIMTPVAKEAVKEVYVKLNKSDKGYDAYLAKLEKGIANKGRAKLEEEMIKKPAPAFSLPGLDGSKTSLASLKGKVVVVDFWATWCNPCIASFPAMNKTKERFKDDKNVEFLFVTSEKVNDALKAKITKLFAKDEFKGFDFKILLDDGLKVYKQFEIGGVPAKFVIDPKGNIRFATMGFNGKEDEFVEELSLMIKMAAEAK